MRKFGLIGSSLKHTFSPSYFAEKFESENITDACYDAYELGNINEICSLMDTGISGLNVTIPFKESVMPFLDKISPEAQEIGAVNTITIEEGESIGFNTDVYGFKESLKSFLNGFKPNGAMVLGSGGASKAIGFVLDQLEIDRIIVSRSSDVLNYESLHQKHYESYNLIINTTPLGMYPNVDKVVDIDFDKINNNHYLYDLVYNPEKTLFLVKGERNGARIANGLEMLKLQAEASWRIWNNQNEKK